jgi:hypothetical protein
MAATDAEVGEEEVLLGAGGNFSGIKTFFPEQQSFYFSAQNIVIVTSVCPVATGNRH